MPYIEPSFNEGLLNIRQDNLGNAAAGLVTFHSDTMIQALNFATSMLRNILR